MIRLDLSWDGGDRIGILPENICNLTRMEYLDVSDNYLCETYVYDCIDMLGSQGGFGERGDCPGYSFYESGMYYDSDINIFKDLRKSNQSLTDIPLLKIGEQKWENGRLVELKLRENEKINTIPESIVNLSDFRRLEIKSDNVITLKKVPKPRFSYTFKFILNEEVMIYRQGENKIRIQGKIRYGLFDKEIKDGEWTYYDENGQIEKIEVYGERNILKKGKFLPKLVEGVIVEKKIYKDGKFVKSEFY